MILGDNVQDARLLSLVRPPTWVNPVPQGRYNLVVLGAGTAGLVCAAGAAGLGAKVALVERHFLGGDCLNFGCVPSKALLSAARIAALCRSADAFGVRVGSVEVDFNAVIDRVRRLRADLAPHDSAERFRSLGVDVYFGSGRFISRDCVEVGGTRLEFLKAVIATGARAALPDIPGLADSGYLTNETIFSLSQLPKRLAVIGAGPIGCELAQAFARFGSQVTLLEQGARVLPQDDPAASEIVAEALRRDGVELHFGAKIKKIEKKDGSCALELENGDRVVDRILVAVGRRPNLENLGLAEAGVDWDAKGGVSVDEKLRTKNPRIYAAGDICSGRKFTHAADAQARIVLRNALFFGRSREAALIMPWCTYTEPEVAQVGLTEEAARKANLTIRTLVQPMNKVDRAVLSSETEGFVKVVLKAGSDQILGATIVGSNAGEMISEITVAMVAGKGLGTLAQVIHPYPTRAEALKKLGDAFMREKLTPWVKTLLNYWLRMGR